MKKRMKQKFTTAGLVILLGYFMFHLIYIYFIDTGTVKQYNDLATVHFIDVGQGDATLIQAENFNMLIDAGESSGAVLNYLNAFDIEYFDYVIATHPHSDHIGGMADILYQYDVKNFIMPNVSHTTATFEGMLFALEKSDANVIPAEAGYTFSAGDVSFIVLGPVSEEYENLNNYSVALKMVAGENSFIFTGDGEKEVEEELLASGVDLTADVYKVSHHGSSTSSTPAFIDAVRPSLAVISCAKDNSYGHPHKETLAILKDYDVKVLRTDKSGTIIVYTDGLNISYGSER
ncbi:MBL fold metallo-hydrolase [Tyzzerella sp. OttesenSCG-928-J15]|nr:MBL fold metallo-hydrolase [Tyzzerella sp. OttesenSCG-928-J15]